MLGIDLRVIINRSNVDRDFKPITQRRRTFNQEWNEVIANQVEDLLKVGFIREVNYPEWLSNVILVKEGKWKMVNVHRFY